jgi:hypothetical protein
LLGHKISLQYLEHFVLFEPKGCLVQGSLCSSNVFTQGLSARGIVSREVSSGPFQKVTMKLFECAQYVLKHEMFSQGEFLNDLAVLEQSLTGIKYWWLGLTDVGKQTFFPFLYGHTNCTFFSLLRG